MKKILNLFIIFSFNLFAREITPYTVFIKPGTVLIRLKDKVSVTLQKGIYAKVLESDPSKRDSYFVYDKAENPQYEMNSLGVVEIDKDYALLPKMDAQKIYPPQNAFKAEDKFVRFDTSLNLHIDSLQVSQLNSIYEDRIKTVMGTRVEINTFYQTELPYKFGASLNYESAYWENDFEKVKLSILSLGPYFKYHFYNEDELNAFVVLGAELAPIYQGKTADFEDNYSAQLFNLGVNLDWDSPIGLLNFGTHFRHHEVSLNKNNRLQDQRPKEFSLNSIGVMIGYKIVWDL